MDKNRRQQTVFLFSFDHPWNTTKENKETILYPYTLRCYVALMKIDCYLRNILTSIVTSLDPCLWEVEGRAVELLDEPNDFFKNELLLPLGLFKDVVLPKFVWEAFANCIL